MEPLDLRVAPPRRPRDVLAGVIFLPRTIDKLRATLRGGDPGAYRIPGFSSTMLEQLGIGAGELTAIVAAATSDDEVGAYVAAHTTPERIAGWNAWALARQPAGGDRAEAVARYPFLAERAELGLGVDVLEEDDQRSFAAPD
jgi:hypothetical protein